MTYRPQIKTSVKFNPQTTIPTFLQWMKQVDRIIASKLMGCDSNDLADCCYQDWFEDGCSPQRAAAKAIKFSGGME